MARTAERERDEGVGPVPVNADLEIEDKVLGPFTARQGAILGAGAVALWLGYAGLHRLVPPVVLLAAALILGGALVAVITTRRDGLSLDRYLLAAIEHHRRGNRYAATDPDQAPAAGLEPIDLPVAGLDRAGVLDLGPNGAAVLVECGTINLQLRSGTEVRTALSAFGQALNALGGAFQFTVTAHRIDLTSQAERVEYGAGQLAHPLLEQRALAYAGLLREISGERDLIARRVLLVLRENGRAAIAAPAVLHRAAQAASLLGACGITARVLSAGEAAAALSGSFDARRPAPLPAQALPDVPVPLAETGDGFGFGQGTGFGRSDEVTGLEA